MVRLRMTRLGRTHRPFYRIAAFDSRAARNGKVIEQLGWFNPTPGKNEKAFELNGERIAYWLDHGARPTETVENLLGQNDLLTPKMKAAWETRREKDRNRVACKTALKTAEAAAEQLTEFAESAEHPDAVNPFVDTVKSALDAARSAVSAADVAKSEAAAADAQKALDVAKAEEAEAKAAAEAEAAEKAAAEAEPSDEAGEAEPEAEEKAEG